MSEWKIWLSIAVGFTAMFALGLAVPNLLGAVGFYAYVLGPVLLLPAIVVGCIALTVWAAGRG